ncbi:hypothetical protein EOD41_11920 [Mucilaginibacter limnophilus]|uniref:Uncharacterized protein n=1 Tax=Mucilaginibacter limnophilus TaxID=1932778 RepID=A0A437MST0_9SPHI|nr:hypothetical protein [Mucilaginibacter limnophilus]RVU00696.1 hypothetical protein EOD41_11920 [Mucilaginibacter limnophilus]
MIEPWQIIGLGAGSTVAYLVNLIEGDEGLAKSVTRVPSSFKTGDYIRQRGLMQTTAVLLSRIDCILMAAISWIMS